MKREHWTVVAADARSGGAPDECFHCRRKMGQEHATDCVIRERTVVVKTTVEHVILAPESWTAEMIDFHRNDSHLCADNYGDELAQVFAYSRSVRVCMCNRVVSEYVREAEAEDEEACGVRVNPNDGAEQ